MNFIKRFFDKTLDDKSEELRLPLIDSMDPLRNYYAAGDLDDVGNENVNNIPADLTEQMMSRLGKDTKMLRKILKIKLNQYMDEVIDHCSENIEEPIRDLRSFYQENEKDILEGARYCFSNKKIYHLKSIYKDKSLAFVVSYFYGTPDQTKSTLTKYTRAIGFGYLDLVAYLTDKLPDYIGGMYHLVFLIDSETKDVSFQLCMTNLHGKSSEPVEVLIVPVPLLTEAEKKALEL